MEDKESKFWLFRDALDFMADRADVINARMVGSSGNISIEGEDADGNVITMHISIARKENDNAYG